MQLGFPQETAKLHALDKSPFIAAKLNTNHIFDIAERSSSESTLKWLVR